METFNSFLIFLVISLLPISFAGNYGSGYSDGLIITPPNYPNSEISFAAPVGAQHPNQKPQPEPLPPPYKYYHDHTFSVNSDTARSYVYFQRTFH
ncbi:hypothetical protein Bhyg_04750 [Pseudolycoriella hygida]|uniref:Transmembrane protein n=1 Tax=Pseudolycoriella hygida TaxID=35572 RepID=A0A9Q0NFY2_9DIPT|nr:hypothetical protein Bhyg_04750 [Pseudolycoriella hygida]